MTAHTDKGLQRQADKRRSGGGRRSRRRWGHARRYHSHASATHGGLGGWRARFLF